MHDRNGLRISSRVSSMREGAVFFGEKYLKPPAAMGEIFACFARSYDFVRGILHFRDVKLTNRTGKRLTRAYDVL